MLAITYLSEMNESFSDDELMALASSSQERNRSHNITGYLYHEGRCFIQYFEGEAQNAEKLLENISKDPRHTIMAIASDEQLASRRFSSWNMKLFHDINEDGVLLEHIWLDLIQWMQNPASQSIEARLWGIVDKVAKYRDGGK